MDILTTFNAKIIINVKGNMIPKATKYEKDKESIKLYKVV